MSSNHPTDVRMEYDMKRDQMLALKAIGLIALGGLLGMPVVAVFVYNVMDSSWQSGGVVSEHYVPQLPARQPVNSKDIPQCQDGAALRWLGCM